MKSIFTKLYVWLNAFLLLFFIVLYQFTVYNYKSNYNDHVFQSLEKEARLIEKLISKAGSPAEIDSLIRKIGEDIGRRVTVILADGKVIGETEKPANELGDHSDRPEVLRAKEKGIGTSKRYSITVKKNLHYLALKSRILGKEGFIRISVYDDLLEQEILQFRKNFILYIISLYFILSLLFASIMFLYRRRIKEVIQMIESLKKGQYEHHTLPQSRDEVGLIVSSLNQLAERLNQLERENDQEKEELNIVINGINDIICLIDKHEKVKLSNEAFQKFFHFEKSGDKFFWEIIPVPEFTHQVKQVFSRKKNRFFEVELQGRYLEVTLNYVPAEETIVAIFHDISDHKKVQRIKKDFVANISHELKTPLTALTGYLETVEHDPETLEQFLPILKRNVQRLKRIVDDLLSLSRLESGQTLTEEFQVVEINDICRKVVMLYKGEAKSKGLELQFETGKEKIEVYGEPYLLEEMMINLVDNALRYTDSGFVHVKTNVVDGKLVIIVEDSGIGIPQEHIDKIFERFFVVDKGRSKRSGGTGLGLSIVKHIVQVHHGEIKVSSTLEKGTRFEIYLPLNAVS